MYRFIRLLYIGKADSENKLLECSNNPYFLGASVAANGFSVKYGMQKCLCCERVSTVPVLKEQPENDVMSWLLSGSRDAFFPHPVVLNNKAQTCPYCGVLGIAHEQTASFVISDNKVSLSVNNSSTPEKALHFNHATGRCTVEVFGQQSPELCDITEGENPIGFSDWIFENSPLANEIFSIFSQRFYEGKPAPRLYFITTLENLVLLNRFQGYEEVFYHSIPFHSDTLSLNESFLASASALRTKEGAVKLFGTLNLPDHKAIKKLFFLRPELMFFSEQIKALPFENTDVIRKFYASKDVFKILECVQKYPEIPLYIKDLVKKYGEARVVDLLKNDFSRITSAIAQSLFSGEEISLYDISVTAYIKHTYCNILTQHTPIIDTVTIDGYTFFQLRSTGEYAIAASKLSNCLYDDEYFNSEIFCVKKDDKYIAAIELDQNTVCQAYLKNNASISTDRKFEAAYKKWLEYFEVEEDETLHPYEAAPLEIIF